MAAWIFELILAVIFAIVNGCTQTFYAQKKGYEIKPKPTAYKLLKGCNLNIVSFACACCEGKITTGLHKIPVISCTFFPFLEVDND